MKNRFDPIDGERTDKLEPINFVRNRPPAPDKKYHFTPTKVTMTPEDILVSPEELVVCDQTDSKGDVTTELTTTHKATAIDEDQARKFLELLQAGMKPDAAIKRMKTTVHRVLKNPAIQEILDWAEIDASQRRQLVLGRLAKIVGESMDEKNVVGAARALMAGDVEMGLSGNAPAPHNQFQIIADDLKVLIDNAPKIPGIED